MSAISRIREIVEERRPYTEMLRAGAEVYLQDEHPNAAFLVSLALRANAPHDEVTQAAARARHDDTIEAHVRLYDGLLHWYGRTMRPPFTSHDIALTLAAVSEGFVLQSIVGETHPRFDTCAAGDDTARDWSLLALVASIIVEAMTVSESDAAAD
jgi:hypothetical protein